MTLKTLRGDFDRWVRLSRLSFPVPAHSKNLAYTLGGITFVGFLILFLTGIWLTQFFNPSPDEAYKSVQTMMNEAPGGRFIRSVHYWASQAVILIMSLHLLRVFITGAYKFPRTMTWYVGVALFFTVTMGSYFSGTVIKWDVEGIDALGHYKVMLDSLGPLGYFFTDRLPGSASLNLRLYTYHITLVPLAIIFLLVCHFYLIHVFNISPLPHEAGALQGEVPREELTATFTDHLRSIIMFSLIYYGAVVILSLINPAPLGAEQVSDITGAKPTWPFLWLYGIENFTGMKGILYGSATLAIILALVPILDRGPSRDPLQRKGILSMGLACLLVMVGLTLYAWIAPPQIHKGHDHDNSASGNQHNSRNEMHDGNEHLDRGTIETEQVHEHNVNQPEAQPSEVGKEVPSHSPTP